MAPEWVDLTQKADEDFTPVPWEDNLTYWEVLAELISSEPPFAEYRAHLRRPGRAWYRQGPPVRSPMSGCAASSPGPR